LAKILHYYGLLEGDSEFKLVCPFHDDINASMKVDIVSGSFYCFGCTVSGDALTFVKLVNKRLSELDACKLYFKILRSKKVKRLKLKTVTRTKRREIDLHALTIAEDYYFGLKAVDWSEDQSPEKQYMVQRGFNVKSLTMCQAKLSYNPHYPLIFPMFDMGEFKGWVCRTTMKSIEKKRKYLYNDGFSRSNTLVGNYNSKVVVLVEGYMDMVKMQMFGLKNVAAILGWKITQQQIDKLKKNGVTTVISALDNDLCGNKGTQYLKNYFSVVRFQFPTGVKDPGDMNQKLFNRSFRRTKKLYRGHKHGIG